MRGLNMYRISKELIMTRLDDEAALLNISTGNYYSLNSTGVRIWELLQQYGNVEDVCLAMQQEYSSDCETISCDVKNLLDSLQNAGLIYLE